MTIWPPPRGSLTRPAYRALVQRVVDAIAAGELRPGAQLPTHRTLAFQLGVSVQTVSRAYEELARYGVVSGEVGRGSFVRAVQGDPRTPWHRLEGADGVIDLSMLSPVTSRMHARRMGALLAEVATDLPDSVLFSFRPSATLDAHCTAALPWLERCGVHTRRELVVPTNGNTAAMTTALMTAAAPGDRVVTEEMGHHTLKALTGALGLRLTGLEVDGQGITVGAFERACRTETVRVLYLMPAGLGPLALCMGEERRRAIAAVARRHDVTIIENDAWGPIEEERPPPFAALAPERTLYFTGLTKCVLPGLRIAWLVVPEQLVSAARTRHLVTSWMATALMAELATRWLVDGTALELLRWQRTTLQQRNVIAARAMAGHAINAMPRGLHLWLPLASPWRDDAFVAHARHHGVAVAGGSAFEIGGGARHRGIRICLGAPPEADLERGLAVVAQLAMSKPEPAHLAI